MKVELQKKIAKCCKNNPNKYKLRINQLKKYLEYLKKIFKKLSRHGRLDE